MEKEYNKHSDYIIIICPTLRWNKTYHSRDWIKNDDKVWLIELKDKLYQWIGKLSQLLARSETLFIIDHIIADEGLDKRRQSLLELAQVGIVTTIYAKAIFVWNPKKRADLKMIHDENNVLTDDELVVVRGQLKKSKHACVYIRNKHPRGFCLK